MQVTTVVIGPDTIASIKRQCPHLSIDVIERVVEALVSTKPSIPDANNIALQQCNHQPISVF